MDKEAIMESMREWRRKDIEGLMVAIDIARVQRGIPIGDLRTYCEEAITNLEKILTERV
jgi:hypothetical protein